MKDMVPKGTGNSRFLRSSIPEGITHEELVALLRAGTFPVDFAGLNPDGIATQGSAYNKANVLPDSLCNLLGLSTSAEPKDAFSALYNRKWKELERITVSKKWTVPSGVTKIGVFLMGAGEGGEAQGGDNYEPDRDRDIQGGSCGYVNNVILDVTPGKSFNVVIGAKGVGAKSGKAGDSAKTPGGDTKFGTYVAYGAGSPSVPKRFYGHQLSDRGAYLGQEDFTTSAVGGFPTLQYKYSARDYDLVQYSFQPFVYGNFFVPMTIASAGGSCLLTERGSIFQQTGSMTDLGKGGDSKNYGISSSNNSGTFYGGNATGYGNGGGACFAATSASSSTYEPGIIGGNGSPGIVIIYV